MSKKTPTSRRHCPICDRGSRDKVKDGDIRVIARRPRRQPFRAGLSDVCPLIIERKVLLVKEETRDGAWPQHTATRKGDEGSELGLEPLSVTSSRRSSSCHVLMELLEFLQHLKSALCEDCRVCEMRTNGLGTFNRRERALSLCSSAIVAVLCNAGRSIASRAAPLCPSRLSSDVTRLASCSFQSLTLTFVPVVERRTQPLRDTGRGRRSRRKGLADLSQRQMAIST